MALFFSNAIPITPKINVRSLRLIVYQDYQSQQQNKNKCNTSSYQRAASQTSLLPPVSSQNTLPSQSEPFPPYKANFPNCFRSTFFRSTSRETSSLYANLVVTQQARKICVERATYPYPKERFIRFRCQLNRKRVTSFKRRPFVALYYPVAAGSARFLFEFDVLVLRYNLSQWILGGGEIQRNCWFRAFLCVVLLRSLKSHLSDTAGSCFSEILSILTQQNVKLPYCFEMSHLE